MITSRLALVSITGADDATNLEDLIALNKAYPGVEWALLYGPGLEGRLRYPTSAWRTRFFDSVGAGASSTAVHLCGPGAFVQLLADTLPSDVLHAKRLQLNLNTRRQDFPLDVVLAIYHKALTLGPEIILQFHEGTANAISLFLAALDERARSRVGVLLDASKGQGIAPKTWDVPEGLGGVMHGFAGGIGPENIQSALEQIAAVEQQAFWVDMESRVRTKNLLDVAKVRSVLSAAASLA